MVSASPEPVEPPFQSTIGWGPGATSKVEMSSSEGRLHSPTSVDAMAQMQQLPGPLPIPGTQSRAALQRVAGRGLHYVPRSLCPTARCGRCLDRRDMGRDLQVLGSVTEQWAPAIDRAVRTVELKDTQRSSKPQKKHSVTN